ncbi:hypothetical protein GF359_04210, partial [candidate division WOR-3 bacterium]|nr:hypothetical protein [candidate division WOR-3 bacterium]MBD3364402.1 hypothetical protein [candidate division WOR-3 bacterium]
MKVKLIATIMLLVQSVSLAVLESRLQKADYYYDNCHTDDSFLDEALTLCNQVLAEDSQDSEALWRIARIHMVSAEDKSTKSAKLEVLVTALEYADRARIADGTSADAHYWYGAVLGRLAQEKGLVNFLTQIKQMKQNFEQALKLDPDHSGALHAMGIWYAEASAYYAEWKDEAESYLTKALRSDPRYSATYITIARFMIREDRFSEARTALNTCISITNPTIPSEHHNYALPEARR